MMPEKKENTDPFLNFPRGWKKGKLKIYIGMSGVGIGKTFRMGQETHNLMKQVVNVRNVYVETPVLNEMFTSYNAMPFPADWRPDLCQTEERVVLALLFRL